jgi:hypothetical protein
MKPAGTQPENIFDFGFSIGGILLLEKQAEDRRLKAEG